MPTAENLCASCAQFPHSIRPVASTIRALTIRALPSSVGFAQLTRQLGWVGFLRQSADRSSACRWRLKQLEFHGSALWLTAIDFVKYTLPDVFIFIVALTVGVLCLWISPRLIPQPVQR